MGEEQPRTKLMTQPAWLTDISSESTPMRCSTLNINGSHVLKKNRCENQKLPFLCSLSQRSLADLRVRSTLEKKKNKKNTCAHQALGSTERWRCTRPSIKNPRRNWKSQAAGSLASLDAAFCAPSSVWGMEKHPERCWGSPGHAQPLHRSGGRGTVRPSSPAQGKRQLPKAW